MGTRSPGAQLLGKRREREVLERLLHDTRGGRGGVLVLYGDPGVGKTALLEYAVEAGPDFRVARAVGVEGEMELAYAALQQLCSPSLEFLERLPDPQREVLAVALGLSAGHAPNTFLVGLAVLGLLSEAAEERPLLCVQPPLQPGWSHADVPFCRNVAPDLGAVRSAPSGAPPAGTWRSVSSEPEIGILGHSTERGTG